MNSWFKKKKKKCLPTYSFCSNAISLAVLCHTFIEWLQNHTHNEHLKNHTELGDDQTSGVKVPALSTALQCRHTCILAVLVVNKVVLQVLAYMSDGVCGPKSDNSRWEQFHWDLQLKFVPCWQGCLKTQCDIKHTAVLSSSSVCTVRATKWHVMSGPQWRNEDETINIKKDSRVVVLEITKKGRKSPFQLIWDS